MTSTTGTTATGTPEGQGGSAGGRDPSGDRCGRVFATHVTEHASLFSGERRATDLARPHAIHLAPFTIPKIAAAKLAAIVLMSVSQ